MNRQSTVGHCRLWGILYCSASVNLMTGAGDDADWHGWLGWRGQDINNLFVRPRRRRRVIPHGAASWRQFECKEARLEN